MNRQPNRRRGLAMAPATAVLAITCAISAVPAGLAGAAAPGGKHTDSCARGQKIAANQCELFVAPGGKDGWAGTASKPLRTIERAQRVVRALRADGAPLGLR